MTARSVRSRLRGALPHLFAILVVALAEKASASPNVPLGDEVYLELAALRAEGKLPAYLGGIPWLTEAEAERLLGQGGASATPRPAGADQDGFWALPIARASATATLVRDRPRPYSLAIRPRQLLGDIAVSCEHVQGRPCGDGLGGYLEMDSAVGYGSHLSAFTRLRALGGSSAYQPAFGVDRAYLNADFGPFALEAGRDVLALGPAVRSALMWSDHTAPADHVRLSTARPFPLLGKDGSLLRASALYFVARLRDPQFFRGTLVSGERLQLDMADRVELGISRTLQIGGQGAPTFPFKRFLWEQVALVQEPNVSNNRLAVDLAVAGLVPGSRIYTELALEDDTPRYDGDMLVGVESFFRMPVLRRTVVEFHRTSSISYEHWLFTTGMENQGRVVGSPLGPEAYSLYGRADLGIRGVDLSPWVEYAVLRSDRGYYFENPLNLTERRLRAGSDAGVSLPGGLRAHAGAFVERVHSRAFVQGLNPWNTGLRLTLTYTPQYADSF